MTGDRDPDFARFHDGGVAGDLFDLLGGQGAIFQEGLGEIGGESGGGVNNGEGAG
jgi:hypothetical protein